MMKKIKTIFDNDLYIEENFEDYPEDIDRIVDVLKEHDYCADRKECKRIWELYSDSYCASWLFLPKSDEDLWKELKSIIVEN